MKKCPKCLRNYLDNSQYCSICGGPLDYYQPKESKGKKAVVGIIKAIFYILIMVGVQNVVTSAFVTAVMMGDPSIVAGITAGTIDIDSLMMQMMEVTLENLTMILLVSNLITILIISLFFTLRKKNPAEEVMLRPVKWSLLPICALYGIALNIFISVTMSFLPLPTEMVDELNNQYEGLFGGTNIVIEILNTAVLTGLVEEIFFRGLALSRLKRGMSRVAAVVVSAVIFGLFHGAFIAVCYATVLGLIFGFLAERHNSILPTVICHMFFNASSFFLTTENVFVILSLYFISIAALFVCSYLLFKKDRIEE